MIKCVAFDIDGTLIDNNDHSYPNSLIIAIEGLKKNDYKIVISTGRPLTFIPVEIINLVQPDYIVCFNGQLVVDANYNVITCFNLEARFVNAVIDYCRKDNCSLSFHFRDMSMNYFEFDDANYIMEKSSGICNNLKISYDHDEHLVYDTLVCCVKPNNIDAFYNLIKKNKNLLIVSLFDGWYDIMRKDINKAIGLKYVLEKLNLSFDECMAFGDSFNDYEMLEAVKVGVALKEASENIKQVSDYVTDTVKNDGIYKALKHFELID